MRKTANYVNCEAVSFGPVFEEALSEFDVPRAFESEQKEAISPLVSGKDQLAVLPTGFRKNLLFQVLVLMKEIMMGKPSSIVVCPLQRNRHLDGINGSYARRLSFGGYRV